jgi:hypothetical protein
VNPESSANVGEVEEGGRVAAGETPSIQVTDPHKRPRESLMLVLAALFCAVIASEFICLFVLAWNTDKKPDSLEKAFNITLPVVAGLVSSVVTFYFTKPKT